MFTTGTIVGWADAPTASALTIVRRTDAMWSALSALEQERAEWVMRGLLAVGERVTRW